MSESKSAFDADTYKYVQHDQLKADAAFWYRWGPGLNTWFGGIIQNGSAAVAIFTTPARNGCKVVPMKAVPSLVHNNLTLIKQVACQHPYTLLSSIRQQKTKFLGHFSASEGPVLPISSCIPPAMLRCNRRFKFGDN